MSTIDTTGVIDFTVPPDLKDLLERVHAFVEEDVLPAEQEIVDAGDILGSWDVVERLRDRARERGIYTPHLPEEWGGLGCTCRSARTCRSTAGNRASGSPPPCMWACSAWRSSRRSAG